VRLIRFVQRKRALGDVLWIEPVVRRLARDCFRVVVVTPYTELFENYPLKNVVFVKKLHPLLKAVRETSKALFGGAGFLDLGGVYERSPRVHLLRAYLDYAGYPREPLSYPRIFLSDKGRAESGASRTVVMHLFPPSARQNYRTVVGVDWAEVKRRLGARGYRVVGIADDASHDAFYHERRDPALRELVALVNSCALFVGLDSGPSHIAAALGRPAVVFFGSVNPELRHLVDRFNGIMMRKPCEHAGCYHAAAGEEERRCLLAAPSEPAPCCLFSTREVLAAIERMLGGGPGKINDK
jgi:ADP-heptose:LPS heptosyltransferase